MNSKLVLTLLFWGLDDSTLSGTNKTNFKFCLLNEIRRLSRGRRNRRQSRQPDSSPFLLRLVTWPVTHVATGRRPKTTESILTTVFIGRGTWHIFPGTSSTSQMCRSSQKCTILQMGHSWKRNKLSNDGKFTANDKVTAEKRNTKVAHSQSKKRWWV